MVNQSSEIMQAIEMTAGQLEKVCCSFWSLRWGVVG